MILNLQYIVLFIFWLLFTESFGTSCTEPNSHGWVADESHSYGEYDCMFPDHRILLSFEESSNQSRLSFDRLPSDCWKMSLQYLSSPGDIGRFRLISQRHHKIYDNMIKLIHTDFQYICTNYSGQKRYRSNKHIERAIPLIPCGVMNFDDKCHSVECLWRFHSISGKNLVRGLVCYSGLSFLSMFLRHDILEKEHILVICFCNHNQLDGVRLYWDREKQCINFKPRHLDLLLQRDYVMINGLDDSGAWTMESKGNQLKRRTIEKCMSSVYKFKQTTIGQKLESMGKSPLFWMCYGAVMSGLLIIFIFSTVGIIR